MFCFIQKLILGCLKKETLFGRIKNKANHGGKNEKKGEETTETPHAEMYVRDLVLLWIEN